MSRHHQPCGERVIQVTIIETKRSVMSITEKAAQDYLTQDSLGLRSLGIPMLREIVQARPLTIEELAQGLGAIKTLDCRWEAELFDTTGRSLGSASAVVEPS